MSPVPSKMLPSKLKRRYKIIKRAKRSLRAILLGHSNGLEDQKQFFNYVHVIKCGLSKLTTQAHECSLLGGRGVFNVTGSSTNRDMPRLVRGVNEFWKTHQRILNRKPHLTRGEILSLCCRINIIEKN